MVFLFFLALLPILMWGSYLYGYRKACKVAKEATEGFVLNYMGDILEELRQWVRQILAGTNLPREDQIELNDDIDREIREVLKNEEIQFLTNGIVEVIHEPTQLKKLMQKGLDNVNKRYGYKK